MFRYVIGLFCFLTALTSGMRNSVGQDKEHKSDAQLSWIKYDQKRFDKERFGRPIIVAFMRDLCPGCKAKRDALWNDSDVTRSVSERKFFLFAGNAQVDKAEAKIVKENFKVKSFPVVIILGKGMGDKPILLSGIPEPKQVIDALEKHFPVGKGNKGE